MLNMFYPSAYVESVFTIDYEALLKKGYRGILFDIDNTLVPFKADATPEIEVFLRSLQAMGFQLLFISNGSAERVQRFLKNIDAPYIDNANKPRPESYLAAAKQLGLAKDEVLCIGDQLFTDIFGANRAHITSILVKFIGYYTEKKLGKRRSAERVILTLYRFDPFVKRPLGNIEKNK